MSQPQAFRNKDESKSNRPGQTSSHTEQSGGFVERTKEAAAGMAQDLSGRAAGAAASVGGSMQSLAETIRDKGPSEGMWGTATGEVARGLETGGRYLREEGFSGMMGDLTSVIKKNPVPAVLIGIGLGFLLARTTSRS